MDKKTKITQEFRQDPFTNEWVLVSTDRINRPHNLVVPDFNFSDVSKLVNPFSAIVKGEAKNEVILELKDSDNQSQVFIVKNKYPLLKTMDIPKYQTEGPYYFVEGEGYHELVIYRDPDTPIRNFSIKNIALMFKAFRDRSLVLMKQKHVRYISVIHNHGYKAGASIYHPHSQIIATPIVPDGIERIIEGARLYHRSNNRDLAQIIIDFELETKSRFISENEDFIAFAPYASKMAYEVEIYPKYSQPHFAYTKSNELHNLARMYKHILQAYYKNLGDIDYNMSIITAPVDGNRYPGFRWFIRLSPRVNFAGGYEIGTDTDICVVSPEVTAEILR